MQPSQNIQVSTIASTRRRQATSRPRASWVGWSPDGDTAAWRHRKFPPPFSHAQSNPHSPQPCPNPPFARLQPSPSSSPPVPAVSVPVDENTGFAQICDPGHIFAFTSTVCGPCHCTRRPTFFVPELTLPHPLPFFSHCINRSRLRAISLIWLSARTARDTGLGTIISSLLKSRPIFAGRRSGTRATLTTEVDIPVDLKWLG